MARKKGEKSSFIMHYEFQDSLAMLTDAEYRELMEGIFEYSKTKIKPQFSSRVLEAVFIPIQSRMKDDMEEYERVCKARSESKQDYWNRKREIQDDTKSTSVYSCTQNDTKSTSVSLCTKNQKNDTKDTDYDTDCDYISVCNNIETNNRVCEENFNCHLGATEKQESCKDCMKKNLCPFKESSKFLLRHPEGFIPWVNKIRNVENSFVEDRQALSSNVDIEDLNWLDDP